MLPLVSRHFGIKGSYLPLCEVPYTTPYTFQAWIHHCHIHPLQAANCCRNSRLVVDEDDLKCVPNEKNILLFSKHFDENFRSKTARFQDIESFFRDAKLCFNASLDHVFIFFWIFIFLKIFLINISMKPEVPQTNYLYTWRTIECFHSIGPHADSIGPALGRQSVL